MTMTLTMTMTKNATRLATGGTTLNHSQNKNKAGASLRGIFLTHTSELLVSFADEGRVGRHWFY